MRTGGSMRNGDSRTDDSRTDEKLRTCSWICVLVTVGGWVSDADSIHHRHYHHRRLHHRWTTTTRMLARDVYKHTHTITIPSPCVHSLVHGNNGTGGSELQRIVSSNNPVSVARSPDITPELPDPPKCRSAKYPKHHTRVTRSPTFHAKVVRSPNISQ